MTAYIEKILTMHGVQFTKICSNDYTIFNCYCYGYSNDFDTILTMGDETLLRISQCDWQKINKRDLFNWLGY